ncbi:MAG TPA: SDR family NAD(P)-dependent oxidoreductase [Pirellulales bacterium]|jgi:NAD(P)-dependent dehydrogenase (short-subunit alcohol dehydrogenase family)|nr:SDR family NAD(P)-dependent oxidoreductase [Pirellulales bacterium]
MAQDQSRQIVLTGASRGLGRAMADGFIAAGHVVHGCARSAKSVAALEQAYPAPHSFAAVDVSDAEAVDRWARKVLADSGPPDLLINNAAIMNRNARLWEFTADEIATILATNVAGVVNVIRAFVPAMVGRGRGVIVNFSSGWGRSTAPEVAPYCATKFAVEGLTKALAQELPHGMVAVPLNPGIIDTEMLRSAFGAASSSYPDPKDWSSRAVPFILGLRSEDSGQSLSVDEEDEE